MSEDRYDVLLSGLLDGELSADEIAELVELARGNPAREREIQTQLETGEMIALSEDGLRHPALFLTAIRSRTSENPFVARVRAGISRARRPRVWRALNPWSLATAGAMALLGIALFVWQFGHDRVIAELAQVQGTIRWTGAGGIVEDRLEEGQPLTGGTLETMMPDALATVRFSDQTSVTIFGQSALTIAMDRQKVLYLRRGNLAAWVAAQPSEGPLLMHTPVADLEVLGTQFSVMTDSTETRLAVKAGRVRLRQRADAKEVEVPASHLAVASIEGQPQLAVVPMQIATNAWTAILSRDLRHGEWISAMHALRLEIAREVESGGITLGEAGRVFAQRAANLPQGAGSVRARPTSGDRAGRVNYAVVLSAVRGLSGPVVLAQGGMFKIRGRVQSPATVLLGFSALDSDQTSGARYLIRRRVTGEFNLELPLDDFQVSTRTGPAPPWGKQLVDWFCLTEDRGAALEITAVELTE